MRRLCACGTFEANAGDLEDAALSTPLLGDKRVSGADEAAPSSAFQR
jgi:hypothetical protein